MESYAGNPANFPATVQLPQDGDPANASSIRPGYEGALDRTAWLKAKFLTTAITRVMPPIANYREASWLADTTTTTNGGLWVSQQINVGDTLRDLWMPLFVPHAAQITAFAIYVAPASGHLDVPQNHFSISLDRRTFSSGVTAGIAELVDTSGSVAIYEAPRIFEATIAAHTTDNALHAYGIRVTNEGGTNAMPGLKVHGARVTFTPADWAGGY